MSPKDFIVYLQRKKINHKSALYLKKEAATAAETLLPFPKAASLRGMSRLGQWIAPMLLLVIDYFAVIAALLTTYGIRRHLLPDIFSGLPYFTFSHSYLYFVLPFIYLTLLFYEQLYHKRLPFWQSVEKLFKTCCFATIISVGFLYFSNSAMDVSRIFVAGSGLIAFIYLAISRYLTKWLMVKIGLWQKPVIIIGHGDSAEILAKAYEDEPNMGHKIVGLIEDDSSLTMQHRYPLLGTFSMAEEVIKASEIKDVIIAAPKLGKDELLDLVYRIRPLVSNLAIMPDLSGVPISNIEVESFFNQRIVLLKIKNNLMDPFNRILKRLLDICAGLLISLVAIPLVILLSFLIRIDSPGPAIFVAKRLGRNGKEFNCYKFRTMYLNNDQIFQAFLKENPVARDEWEKYAKIKKEDPRITRLGRFLRKTSLDELPQIFNVIKGEMSLVGPRPYLPRESDWMGYQATTILEATPGITGLWQVSGRNDIDFEGRLQLDSWYVRNWSVWLDVTLLVKTIGVVLKKEGAY